MGFAIAGVSFFADTFVQGGSSVLRIKFSAKTPRHRKPPNRYTLTHNRKCRLIKIDYICKISKIDKYV